MLQRFVVPLLILLDQAFEADVAPHLVAEVIALEEEQEPLLAQARVDAVFSGDYGPMKFSTLAGTVGGGLQTPGFLGIGKYFVTSRKFLAADGGFPRIVWMTTSLKEFLGDALKKRAEECGMPDLVDKIADERVATDAEQLVEHLTKVGHPAMEMASILDV